MTETKPPEVLTYNASRRPVSPGIGPLRLVPSVIGMTALALAVMSMMAIGVLAGVILLLITVVVCLPMVIHRRERTLYAAWTARWRFSRAERRGASLAQTGLTGVTRDRLRRLPGLLAQLECWSVDSDGLGRPFALIEIPRARQWAVVFRVVPEGGALVDRETRDFKVDAWGNLLALVGRTGGVRQVQAVVESLPDGGAMLSAHVEAIIDPTAPVFAREVLHAAARELPQGVTSSIGYVSVTFSEKGLGIAPGSSEQRAQAAKDEIGRRLPELSVQLNLAGAATATPLAAYELTQRIKEGYNPLLAIRHAEMSADGDPPRIEWDDCGPTSATERYGQYRHDGAISVTYEALKIRSGTHTDRVLERLVAPMREAPRKRVTFIYLPTDEGEAGEVLDRDVKASINRANRRKGVVHAQDQAALNNAQAAATDEAAGAGVVDISVLVTVTVTEPSELPKACTAVERAGRSSRFTLDKVYGGQAASFAICLGLGLAPADLSAVPDLLRDHT